MEQDQEGWVAGAFTVQTTGGAFPVAGWLKEQFALDFRVWDSELNFDDGIIPGWTLTHLPTGFQACAIMAQLDVAMSIADEIIACADWNFSDPAQAKPRAIAVRPIFEKHGGKVARRSATVSSTFRDIAEQATA